MPFMVELAGEIALYLYNSGFEMEYLAASLQLPLRLSCLISLEPTVSKAIVYPILVFLLL